jgi:hypothetical protein
MGWLDRLMAWRLRHKPLRWAMVSEVFVDKDGGRYTLPPVRMRIHMDSPLVREFPLDWSSDEVPKPGTPRYELLMDLIRKEKQAKALREAKPGAAAPRPRPTMPAAQLRRMMVEPDELISDVWKRIQQEKEEGMAFRRARQACVVDDDEESVEDVGEDETKKID